MIALKLNITPCDNSANAPAPEDWMSYCIDVYKGGTVICYIDHKHDNIETIANLTITERRSKMLFNRVTSLISGPYEEMERVDDVLRLVTIQHSHGHEEIFRDDACNGKDSLLSIMQRFVQTLPVSKEFKEWFLF